MQPILSQPAPAPRQVRASPVKTYVGQNVDVRAIRVVAAATVVMAMGFGVLALTAVLIRPLEAEFGWSRADVSLGYAVATAGMAVGGMIWGRAADRLDTRILLAVGGLGMAMPLFAMAAVRSLWQLYLANFVLGGFGFAVLYAPLLSVPSAWFNSRRGLAIGVVTAGGALGQGVVPFVANLLIDGIGWRFALLGLAVTSLIALLVALPAIRGPLGADRSTSAPAQDDEHSAKNQQSRLLALSAAAFLCCACMGMPLVHLASFVGSICGSPALGATSLLIAMLSGTLGRICFGLIADRAGNLPSYALASALQTACVAIYPLLAEGSSLLLLSAVFGFGFAGNMTCLILCVGEAVARQRFGTAIGVVMFVAWTGMGAGAYAAGLLFDATLDYTVSFRFAAAAGLINLLVIGAMCCTRSAAGPAEVAG